MLQRELLITVRNETPGILTLFSILDLIPANTSAGVLIPVLLIWLKLNSKTST